MKNFLLVFTLVFSSISTLFGQETLKKKPVDLSGRANDHLVIQLGYATWSGAPDTIAMGNFSKTLNVHFMLDKPFKSNPKLSIGIGAGIGTDHIHFSKVNIGIKEGGNTFPFTNVRDTNHFKKSKLATTYIEAPLEFRYSANPETGKGFNFAIGFKAGTLFNAHTRNAKLENRNGTLINDYVMKESSSRFINKTRFAATARAGYGHISLFTSIQLNPTIRDGFGPKAKPFTIGLVLSGL
jgi:hypothetical protein